MEDVVLHRVWFLENFRPKQGQDFKPSAAPLYPHMSQVPFRELNIHFNKHFSWLESIPTFTSLLATYLSFRRYKPLSSAIITLVSVLVTNSEFKLKKRIQENGVSIIRFVFLDNSKRIFPRQMFQCL